MAKTFLVALGSIVLLKYKVIKLEHFNRNFACWSVLSRKLIFDVLPFDVECGAVLN